MNYIGFNAAVFLCVFWIAMTVALVLHVMRISEDLRYLRSKHDESVKKPASFKTEFLILIVVVFAGTYALLFLLNMQAL